MITRAIIYLFVLYILNLIVVPNVHANWTSSNGDLHHSRFQAFDFIPPLDIRWSSNLSVGQQVPVIDGNTLYITPQSSPKKLKAVDVVTGKLKWEMDFNDGGQGDGIYYDRYFSSSPAVKNGIVYAGSSERFYAVKDLGDKPQILWSVPLKLDNMSAVILNNTIYVVDRKSDLIALDLQTGKKKWGTSVALASKPVVLAEGRIFAAGVTVLRAYTDKGSAYSTVWSKKLGDSGELIQPVYRNGIVYTGIGNTLYALHAGNGNLLWKKTMPSTVELAPALGKSDIILNLKDQTTIAVDLKTGSVKWKTNAKAVGAPLVLNNLVYIASNGVTGTGGIVHTLDASNGKVLDTLKASGNNDSRVSLLSTKDFIIFSTINDTFGLLPKSKNIQIFMEGTKQEYDRLPKVVQGRTLVPMRAIFESLGANVVWDGASKSVTATKDDQTMKLTINRLDAIINQRNVTLDIGPRMIDGSTYVPLRFISESFDSTVIWDGTNKYINIYFYREFGAQKLVINGESIPNGISLKKDYSGLMLDAKPLFSYLQGQIHVDKPIGQATVDFPDGTRLTFTNEYPNNRTVTVNNQEIPYVGPHYYASDELSREGHFQLNLDFFTKAYGWDIYWDKGSKTVNITTD